MSGYSLLLVKPYSRRVIWVKTPWKGIEPALLRQA